MTATVISIEKSPYAAARVLATTREHAHSVIDILDQEAFMRFINAAIETTVKKGSTRRP
jgi:hypothetical protein